MMAIARVSAIGISQDSLIRRLPRTSAAPLFSANQFGHPVRNGSTAYHHRICRGEHFPCAAVMVASRGTDGLQTRRRREPDSNHESRVLRTVKTPLSCGKTSAFTETVV